MKLEKEHISLHKKHTEELIQAITAKDNQSLLHLLSQQYYTSGRDGDGKTLLMIAVLNLNIEACKILLNDGLDPKLYCYDDFNALSYAVISHSVKLCRILIEAGVDVNCTNTSGRNALMLAATVEDDEIVELLLENGAIADTQDCMGSGPIECLNPEVSTTQGRRCKKLIKKSGGRSNKRKSFRKTFIRGMVLNNDYLVLKDLTFQLHNLALQLFLAGAFLSVILYFFTTVTCFVFAAGITCKTSMEIFGRKSNTEKIFKVGTEDSFYSNDFDVFFARNIFKLNLPKLDISAISDHNYLPQSTLASSLVSFFSTSVSIIIIFFAWTLSAELNVIFAIAFGYSLIIISLLNKYFLREFATNRLYEQQNIRDEIASNTVEEFQKNGNTTNTEFAMYLRSFETTGKLLQAETGIELETAMAQLFPSALPIFAFGEPGEHIGASRILTSEEEWQKLVASMLSSTQLILLIPSIKKGTLWEIEHIAIHQFLSKTVFIMLPTIKSKEDVIKQEWDALAIHLKGIGLHLPVYRKDGLLFMLSDEGEIEDHKPFSHSVYIDPDRRMRQNGSHF